MVDTYFIKVLDDTELETLELDVPSEPVTASNLDVLIQRLERKKKVLAIAEYLRKLRDAGVVPRFSHGCGVASNKDLERKGVPPHLRSFLSPEQMPTSFWEPASLVLWVEVPGATVAVRAGRVKRLFSCPVHASTEGQVEQFRVRWDHREREGLVRGLPGGQSFAFNTDYRAWFDFPPDAQVAVGPIDHVAPWLERGGSRQPGASLTLIAYLGTTGYSLELPADITSAEGVDVVLNNSPRTFRLEKGRYVPRDNVPLPPGHPDAQIARTLDPNALDFVFGGPFRVQTQTRLDIEVVGDGIFENDRAVFKNVRLTGLPKDLMVGSAIPLALGSGAHVYEATVVPDGEASSLTVQTEPSQPVFTTLMNKTVASLALDKVIKRQAEYEIVVKGDLRILRPVSFTALEGDLVPVLGQDAVAIARPQFESTVHWPEEVNVEVVWPRKPDLENRPLHVDWTVDTQGRCALSPATATSLDEVIQGLTGQGWPMALTRLRDSQLGDRLPFLSPRSPWSPVHPDTVITSGSLLAIFHRDAFFGGALCPILLGDHTLFALVHPPHVQVSPSMYGARFDAARASWRGASPGVLEGRLEDLVAVFDPADGMGILLEASSQAAIQRGWLLGEDRFQAEREPQDILPAGTTLHVSSAGGRPQFVLSKNGSVEQVGPRLQIGGEQEARTVYIPIPAHIPPLPCISWVDSAPRAPGVAADLDQHRLDLGDALFPTSVHWKRVGKETAISILRRGDPTVRMVEGEAWCGFRALKMESDNPAPISFTRFTLEGSMS